MKRAKQLEILQTLIKIAVDGYGGKGSFELPSNHIAALQVPKGGSCCLNCEFVDEEKHECKSPYYIKWNGNDPKLPDLPLDEICSDWWQGK